MERRRSGWSGRSGRSSRASAPISRWSTSAQRTPAPVPRWSRDCPEYTSRDTTSAPGLAYSRQSRDVTHTLIDGQLVMNERKLLTLDEAGVVRRAEAHATRIAAQLE